MLKRKVYDYLLKWKSDENKKALCITGARQIGKTTAIREFGKNEYDNFVELNFLTDTGASKIFSGALDAETLITNLTAYTRTPMEEGRTLVLLDEIQECPEARTAIKFLVEDGRFDYIESGSLLGVNYRDVRSLPVGYEEIYEMYPMDFEEFTWANGVQHSTIEYLKKCYEEKTLVSEPVHAAMCKLFYVYMVVGGMPDVVKTYVETHDIARVIEVQKAIIALYRLDISKYAEGSNRIKIQSIFDSIPSQLDEKNRRFILSAIDSNGRQNRYQDSFNWLADAGIALPCYNVSKPQPPVKLNEKRNLFKLFMGDTGLLCAASMENVQFDLLNGELEVNSGSILENMVAQQLISNDFNINYFDSKKYGELDFVIQDGSRINLIEVKSGKDYHFHSALNRILKVDAWDFDKAVVLCRGNIEVEEDIVYLPWYMIMFMKPVQFPDKMIYNPDLSSLDFS